MTDPGELKVDVHSEGGRVVLALDGELDLATVGRLEDAIARHAADAPQLVLDLRALGFVDSTGLRALFLAAEAAEVVFVRGPAKVHHVFEVTGLDERFTFVDAP